MKYRIPLATSIVAVLLLMACSIGYGSDDERNSDKAGQLGWIAIAVNGFVTNMHPPESMSGEELIANSTKLNPALLTPMDGLFITARNEGDLSSVLLCDKDKKFAIAEDAGCTPTTTDAPLWKEKTMVPCEFKLDLILVCNGAR